MAEPEPTRQHQFIQIRDLSKRRQIINVQQIVRLFQRSADADNPDDEEWCIVFTAGDDITVSRAVLVTEILPELPGVLTG